MKHDPEVGICILHTSLVHIEWAMNTYSLLRDTANSFKVVLMTNTPYDTAREVATREFLKKKSRYVFHLDSDVLPPSTAINELIRVSKEYRVPVVSGVFWARKAEGKMACAWKKTDHGFEPFDIKPFMEPIDGHYSLLEADAVGAGCLLIDTSVLRKLDKSDKNKAFFEWGFGRKYPDGSKPLQYSEDFNFCNRLVDELGVHPMVYTGVQCGHICQTVKRPKDGEYELI